jgi:hypothetical protein
MLGIQLSKGEDDAVRFEAWKATLDRFLKNLSDEACPDSIGDQVIFTCDFEFAQYQTNLYPVEVGVCAVSLKSGVKNSWHALIDPGRFHRYGAFTGAMKKKTGISVKMIKQERLNGSSSFRSDYGVLWMDLVRFCDENDPRPWKCAACMTQHSGGFWKGQCVECGRSRMPSPLRCLPTFWTKDQRKPTPLDSDTKCLQWMAQRASECGVGQESDAKNIMTDTFFAGVQVCNLAEIRSKRFFTRNVFQHLSFQIIFLVFLHYAMNLPLDYHRRKTIPVSHTISTSANRHTHR